MIKSEFKTGFKHKLLATSVLAAAMGGVPFVAAHAQDVETVSQAAEDAEAVQETVVVTGSRLSQANVTSSSPVTTVDAEAFAIRGTVDTIDLVNTLPGVFAGQTGAVGNGATGTSTLNLRGLGATRTLVLANGKRLPPGGPTGGTFPSDINLIPNALVERVEIVTGGASAVYGSDAIGGVANFILRDDFEGFEVDFQYGFNQTNNNDDLSQAALDAAAAEDVISGGTTDNPTFNASVLFGTNLDNGKGNVTAYFTYLSQDGVLQNNRDFSRCAQFQLADEALCVGSGAGPFPSTFFIPQATDVAGNPIGESGTFSLAGIGGLEAGANNPFNFAPLNPLQRPVERFNAGFSSHYEINEHFEVYADFGFTQNSTDSQIAPSASFSGAASEFGCDNPFLSAEQVQIFCTDRGFSGTDIVNIPISRRVVEAGPRTTSIDRSNFRIVGGVRGEIIPGIDYDVFGQLGDTQQTILQTNQVTLTALQQSVDVVTDPATGQPICRAELEGTVTGCVPFNLFDTTATNEGIGTFLDTPSLNTGEVRQFVFGGTVTADGNEFGIVSPFATSGVQALVGLERREERLVNQADSTNQQGLLVGAGGPVLPTNAETELFEVFTELQVPVIQDLPFIEEFTLTGAYRYSDYSSFDSVQDLAGGDFTANTWSVGASWVPVEDIRLRGQFQRAIRAPNIIELFAPLNTGLVGISDPCSGPTPTSTAAACLNTGVSAALFGSIPPDSGQLNILLGGNANLEPEESDTFTVGAVIQPRWVDGLTVSVDYFNIEVDGFVGTVPAATILTDCLADAASELCGFINRSPQDGSLTQDLGFIELNLQNVAAFETSGVDFQVDYGFDAFGYGDVSLNYNATYLIDSTLQSLPTAPGFNCVGIFDDECGGPSFDYRHNVTLTYNTPFDLQISALWRFFSGVDRIGTADVNSGTFMLFADEFPDANIRGDTLGSESFLDLSAFYDVTENVEVRFGVNNVFDNTPGIVDFNTSGADGNVFSNVQTSTGRFIFVGFKANF